MFIEAGITITIEDLVHLIPFYIAVKEKEFKGKDRHDLEYRAGTIQSLNQLVETAKTLKNAGYGNIQVDAHYYAAILRVGEDNDS